MSVRKIFDVPLNRVEGDLEIRIEVADGVVADAWSSGTLYRGFEKLLVGRGALDGLVITPRICGICCTTHLNAAARALDAVAFGEAGSLALPDNAIRLRNVALMAEHIQSDVRQSVLMYLVDFANPAYAGHALHDEAVRRYAPLGGQDCIETIKETKKVVEIIAILGGQWPHSSFMVPGGVAFSPQTTETLQCRHILKRYQGWYERRILGCSVERWREVQSAGELDAWLDEKPAHRDGALGFFLRFARSVGLDRSGAGHGNFISFGSLDIPEHTGIQSGSARQLVPAGFVHGGSLAAFDQDAVAEHVAHSWYHDYEGGKHPFHGETKPYASGAERGKYSWVKAPRYNGLPAETGPLAEMAVAGDPLIQSLLARDGVSALLRQLARLTRPATLMPAMDAWLAEIAHAGEQPFIRPAGDIEEGRGAGLTQAARGALGHWVRIENGKISHYQVITPTAWNGSPRDGAGVRGPWEEALVGTAIADPDNPIEAGHVIRSFDPCLVCSVHAVERGTSRGRFRMAF